MVNPLRRQRNGWGDNIKMDLADIDSEVGDEQ
jgi:hypothetical protein